MRKLSVLLFAAMLSLSFAVTGIAADKKATAAKPTEAARSVPAGKNAEPAAKQGLLDINTASEADLKAIGGIGDTYSKKIIAGRPYAKKDQLLSKKILPKATYDKIKDKIITSKSKK